MNIALLDENAFNNSFQIHTNLKSDSKKEKSDPFTCELIINLPLIYTSFSFSSSFLGSTGQG
jgi:hypothetical protein